MTWIFLGVAAVETLQANLIEKYGGTHGLRDKGLLISAVMRAENKASYDPDATVVSVGASLGYGLIKNHAFIDGNKRVGLAALVDFLALNSLRFVVSEEEQIAATWRAAASEVTEAEFAAWVEQSVGPL